MPARDKTGGESLGKKPLFIEGWWQETGRKNAPATSLPLPAGSPSPRETIGIIGPSPPPPRMEGWNPVSLFFRKVKHTGKGESLGKEHRHIKNKKLVNTGGNKFGGHA